MGKKREGDDPFTWGIDGEQLDFSSQHEPIEDVEIRFMGSKKKHQGKRRAADARMFESFTPNQEKAFIRIGRGHMLITNGIGHKSQIFVPLSRGQGGMDPEQEKKDGKVITAYWAWHRECQAQKLDAAVALDVIVYGMNLTESAEARRTYRKSIRDNLIACLNVYCETNGWDAEMQNDDTWRTWIDNMASWLKETVSPRWRL